ncbi:MAG: WGR domain-containing protein, partial [Planctomycetes bacterium]|nr:WGR domain-containing protein [Planctomycetota bacterium]
PLHGVEHLKVDGVRLWFEAAHTRPPAHAWDKLRELDKPESLSLEIVEEGRLIDDLADGRSEYVTLRVASPGVPVTQPVYVQGYASWEHLIGHHDPLTDIFSLGMLLAGFSLGLDLADAEDLETFVGHRENLFELKPDLHPVLAKAIVRMTELHRHKRAQDLPGLLRTLENYRDQAIDVAVDLARIRGFKEKAATDRRRTLLERLRERLFEISRRNRLLYHRPTLNSLNLTIASVPLLFDARGIRPEQLLTWQPDFAKHLLSGEAIPLGRYLRFEDAPYIAGVLDHIIAGAKRDQAEFGFSQLRLVLCFLRWHNLKEAKEERIETPLVLLPVQLTKKKGVRDVYVLQAHTTEAEINPTLRYHLRQLYGIRLPESVDLSETTLDELHELLSQQIQAGEPAVVLNKLDKPHVRLIHEKARRRLDQYQRRLGLRGRGVRSFQDVRYSYDRETFAPLGLKLFQTRVRPAKAELGDLVSGRPRPRDFAITEHERDVAAFQEGSGSNPYAWDFDLCSVTLGNFNYRKMSLVRDYDTLIESEATNPAFDAIFSLAPKAAALPSAEAPALEKRYPVVACDPTQAAAIAQARSGRSFIIQGPPGTGKSQTITNLIADYVAAGRRVLFVCEKRAAIDVVYQRLKQQGLHELCCLIHDSQEDKKAFILDLKQTYEAFLSEATKEEIDWPKRRDDILRAIRRELEPLERFDAAMKAAPEHVGMPLRRLIQRRVELSDSAVTPPKEGLPEYRLWNDHRDSIDRLVSALREVEKSGVFLRHPLSLLNGEVLKADSPRDWVAARAERARTLLGAVAGEAGSLGDAGRMVRFAESARFLAKPNLYALLDAQGAAYQALVEGALEQGGRREALEKAREGTRRWKEKLPKADVGPALELARSLTGPFAFLRPSWWRLRGILRKRYPFHLHIVKPSWVDVLEALQKEYRAEDAVEEGEKAARAAYGIEEPLEEFVRRVQEAQRGAGDFPKKIAADAILGLADLRGALDAFLAGWEERSLGQLQDDVDRIEEALDLLPDFLPCLGEIEKLPKPLAEAFRRLPLDRDGLEAGIADRGFEKTCLQDRFLARFTGAVKERHLDRLDRLTREWHEANARCLRASVRDRFLRNVAPSSKPEDRAFKKLYATGRKELEREFGKTMRYRSIRDLLQDPEAGRVIQDLEPVWLMSPLSVSDTRPLDAKQLDVVIFDEASQIPLEEGIPSAVRADQVIIVGDPMQLPPTTFFSARPSEDDLLDEDDGEPAEVDLSSNSFLAYAARTLPSTMLAWHYRSRYESLISFSNSRFYDGRLLTVPESARPVEGLGEIRVQDPAQGEANVERLLERSVSFHRVERGIYEERRNEAEAAYIAHLVRGLLARGSGLSVGIVAFSEAQQGEIERALEALAGEDAEFRDRLEREMDREEDGQFLGLLVKNLENIQGDERDVMILSVCYGKGRDGRMLMNFGPINQAGGEKRLNVAFSRAKRHMAVVGSIDYSEITNEYNDGANCLRNYLRYAAAVSTGDGRSVGRVLEEIRGRRERAESEARADAVAERLARELRARGYEVDLGVGQSKLRCDVAVKRPGERAYLAAVLVDTMDGARETDVLARDLMTPGLLRAFGWRVVQLLAKDWVQDRDGVLNRLAGFLRGERAGGADEEPLLPPPPMRAGLMEEAPEAIESAEAAPVSSGNWRRAFEFKDERSSKFWEIAVEGARTTVRFGRIGTDGQTLAKEFSSPADAARDAERLIREKLGKGYRERG